MSFTTVNNVITEFLASNVHLFEGDNSHEEKQARIITAFKEQAEDKLKTLLKQKSTKTKKDPNAPKKRSAYNFFCMDERAKVKAEFPDMISTDIQGELGKRWKALDEDDALEYHTKAAADKEKYEEDMKTYVSSDGEKPEKKSKAKKDPNAPKKRTAYNLFCKDERENIKAEFPTMPNSEVLAELGARWKDLADENPDKVKEYKDRAEEDKKAYIEAMKTYVPSDDEKPKEKKPRAKRVKKVEEVEKDEPVEVEEVKVEVVEKPKTKAKKAEEQSAEKPKTKAKKVEDPLKAVKDVIQEVIEAADGADITAKQVKTALKEKGIEVPENLKQIIKEMI
jgi:HMG (high mobility group) box